MTKAGGIPALPIAPPETSGHRSLGKGGQSREGAEPGFGFPEHLTNIEGEKGQAEARAPDLTRERKGRSLMRSALADVLAADVGQRGDADPTSQLPQDSISDFVADLKRMLAGKPAGEVASDEANPDANNKPDATQTMSLLDTLENVVALIPQSSSRPTGSVLRVDAGGSDKGEAKVFALPLALRQNAALRTAHSLTAADENLPMPGGTSPTDTIELPVAGGRSGDVSTARTSESDADTKPKRESMTAEVKVTAIRQETHFAPMMRSSPAIQIADAVAGGLSDLETQNSTRAIFDPTTAKANSTAPLRVLQVQLQPVELGTVTISISLKADVLELHLDAMRPDTADMLRRDREVLSDLLRQAGYDVGSVSVRIAETDAGALSTGSNPSQTTGQQLQSASLPGQQQANGSTPDDRSRGTRQQDQGQHSAQSDVEAGRTDRLDTPGSRGVYI